MDATGSVGSGFCNHPIVGDQKAASGLYGICCFLRAAYLQLCMAVKCGEIFILLYSIVYCACGNGGEKEVKLILSVAESDMGMVIGKGGKIAKAIRTVMKAAAATDGRRVNVEIRD